MTRQHWTTKSQRQWLLDKFPEFVKARESGTTAKKFFPKVFTEWRDAFPIDAPTPKELAEAVNMSDAVKKKRAEKYKQIKAWFHNTNRGIVTAGIDTSRGILKIKRKSKRPQEWQIYQRLTYKDHWKPIIDKEWQKFRDEWEEKNGSESKPPHSRFAFMNVFLKTKYAEETDEMKERVQELRDQPGSGEEDDAEDDNSANKRNKNFQQAIHKLPRTMLAMAESLAKQTGWSISILAGGPEPHQGGEIKAFMIHSGTTPEGDDFSQFLGEDEYNEHIAAPFDDFLHAAFPEDVCDSRALVPEDEDEEAEQRSRQKKGKKAKKGKELESDEEEDDGEEEDDDDEKQQDNGEEEQDDGEDMEVDQLDGEDDGDDDDEGGEEVAVKKVRKHGGKSEYELRKEENIRKNKALLKQLEVQYPIERDEKAPPPKTASKAPKPTTAAKGKKKEKTPPQPTRSSTRKKGTTSSKPNQAAAVVDSATTTNAEGAASLEASPAIDDSDSTAPGTKNIAATRSSTRKKGTTSSKPNQATAAVDSATTTNAQGAASLEAAPMDIASNGEVDNAQGGPSLKAPVIETTTNAQGAASLEAPADGAPVDDTVDNDNTGELEPPSCAQPTPARTSDDSEAAGMNKNKLQRRKLLSGPNSEIDMDTLPAWLTHTGMVDYLYNVSNDKRWRRLLYLFYRFEKANPPTGNIPNTSRPDEVVTWIRSKRKNSAPNIVDIEAFAESYLTWWLSLQPEWRTGNSDVGGFKSIESVSLMVEAPGDEEWQILCKGGSAGIYTVVVALSWWLLKEGLSARVLMALEDIKWVVGEMVILIENDQSKKRGRKDDTEVREGSKRLRK
ncbi:hypothetical protein BJ912DRAFT_1070409 [Pholiota molesta]|nr:hypothetical protein BJ912DRAFT_1070409 [Pholiota molesta]